MVRVQAVRARCRVSGGGCAYFQVVGDMGDQSPFCKAGLMETIGDLILRCSIPGFRVANPMEAKEGTSVTLKRRTWEASTESKSGRRWRQGPGSLLVNPSLA